MILVSAISITVELKIIINCAMSADGKIALRTRRQTHISNEADKKRVHELRNSADAILVGIETVLSDDPKLTVNSKYVSKPRHPLRIVLDSTGRTPKAAQVILREVRHGFRTQPAARHEHAAFDGGHGAEAPAAPAAALVLDGVSETLIVTNDKCKKKFPNAEVIRCGKKDVDLKRLMKILEKRGVRSLLVEGGSKVIWSFLDSRIADEVNIFIGSMVIGGEVSPTPAGGLGAPDEKSVVALQLKSVKALGNGVLVSYKVVK